MTDERLASYADWAGHPDRDPQAARIVRELVAEVRRLREEKAAPVPPFRGILDGITAADVYGVHQ